VSIRFRNNLIAGLIVTVFLVGLANAADPIVTDSTNNVTTTGTQVTTVKSPPPSAISTNIGGSNSDLCTISSSGAMGTQVLSLSLGATYTEANCLRLKKASKLYTFGMKVAAVSVMCQDPDVWQAMMDAGTPCPIDGLIGNEAKAAWEVRQDLVPMPEGENELTAEQKRNKAFNIIGAVAGAVLLF
tara:strand:- start:437 stop:994 length:558 start_codon:yes stop_codon:yes gene_type:complete